LLVLTCFVAITLAITPIRAVTGAARRVIGGGGSGNTPADIFPKFCGAAIQQSRTNPQVPAGISFHDQLKKFVENLPAKQQTVARAVPSAAAHMTDANIINMYVAQQPDYYRYVNCWMNNMAQPDKPKWIDGFISSLREVLMRQPEYRGKQFRGTGLDIIPNVGDIIRNRGFLSSTTKIATATSFLQTTQYPAYMLVFTDAGRDISRINPGEGEVIVPDMTCFRVTDFCPGSDPFFMKRFPELSSQGIGPTTKNFNGGVRLVVTNCVSGVLPNQEIKNILEMDGNDLMENDFAEVESVVDDIETLALDE